MTIKPKSCSSFMLTYKDKPKPQTIKITIFWLWWSSCIGFAQVTQKKLYEPRITPGGGSKEAAVSKMMCNKPSSAFDLAGDYQSHTHTLQVNSGDRWLTRCWRSPKRDKEYSINRYYFIISNPVGSSNCQLPQLKILFHTHKEAQNTLQWFGS